MKVVKLTINEDIEFEGIDAVALVGEPAIEIDFMKFSKDELFAETHNDYPQEVRRLAQVAIDRNRELNNKCGTQVGKVRAQQLAQGRPISMDTIKRMRSFLIRQKSNYDLAVRRKDYNACGYISYLLWGGPMALPWAEKKLRQAGLLEAANEEIIIDYFAKEKLKKKKLVYLIACSSEKLSKPALAKDLYDSPLFKKSLNYARKKASSDKDIKILSAKYKLVDMDQKIKPYDLALGDIGAEKRKEWATEVYNTLKKRYDLNTTQFIFLAGEDYSGYLMEMLPHSKDVLSGKRLGERLGYLSNFTRDIYCTKEEALHNAHKLGFSGYKTQKLKDTVGYIPFNSEIEELNEKYFDNLTDEQQQLLLKALDNVGLTEESLKDDGWVEITEDAFNNHLYFAIVSDPDKGSLQDTSNYKVLYKYEGPRDSKNRTFCKDVLGKNLLFRIEDINNMSLTGANNEFGTYDIFTYKGSYNCRHRWVQKFFRRFKPLDEQKRATTSNSGPREVIGGPRVQEASQRNPKSRTTTQIAEGVPEGQFEFKKQMFSQQLLAGPLMVADKLIPRIDEETGEKYYVFFDADGIKKLSYKLMKNKLIDSVNIEHDQASKVDDITLVETWIIDDPNMDKSKLYGYDNLSKGSWFGVYKVNNKKVWDEYVETGLVKGFSVEGIFADKVILNNANYTEK